MLDISVNCHSSIKIGNMYFDPYCIEYPTHDAKIVFITHSHHDHLSVKDVLAVSNDETAVVATPDCAPWFYSALYNGAYMLPDMVILLVIGVILMKTPAKKYVTGQDLA